MDRVKTFIKRNAKLMAFLLVVVATFGSGYLAQSNAIERERNAQVATCLRVQFLRDQANGTNFLIYDTFKLIVVQQTAAIKSGKLKGPALKMAKQSLARSQRVVSNTVITGPTNCVSATDNPETYRAPAPEFIKSESPRVKIARKRAAGIVLKAAKNAPLYTPADFRRLKAR